MKQIAKVTLLTALGIGVLLASGALNAQAQNWQTVDNLQSSQGLPASGSDITIDISNTLYAVGGASLDTNDTQRIPIVNVSTNRGGTWTTLMEASQRTYDWEHYRAVASDASGRMYVGGDGHNADWPSGTATWLIRERAPGDSAWITTDSLPGDNNSGCSDIAINPLTGDVYAGGSSATLGRSIRRRAAGETAFSTVFSTGPSDYGSAWSIGFNPTTGVITVAGETVDPSTRASRWVTLSSPTGNPGSWKTNDTFVTGEWTGIAAGGVLVTRSGTIYVAGSAYSSKQHRYYWVVRTSADGGSTWTISDTFSYGGYTVQVFEMTQDAAGNLYVCGQASGSSNGLFWLVRKGTWTTSTVKGKTVTSLTWSTSDAYQYAVGKPALPLGITVDASNNVFVCGRAQDTAGVDHFIVRKLAAQ